MRHLVLLISLAAVAACGPTIPDSGAGVGFASYDDMAGQRQLRDQQLSGQAPLVGGGEISQETVATGSPVPLSATVSGAPNNPGISDEQDFSAVASRETIESDKQRLAQQADAYQVIAPTALPTRSGSSGPSIVEYALATTNSVGQPIYSRSSFSSQSRYQRNCAKYPSSDLAQIDFLKAGGPKRDGKGLDPDGDGFACYWDPSPFRLAVSGN